jgi:acetyl esterase/lipase
MNGLKKMSFATVVLLCLAVCSVHAQEKKEPKYPESVPEPTMREVSYGSHERHVMDVWLADSKKPTPLVFVIHGGGWMGGTKERLKTFVDTSALLDAGISVVAINYRLIPMAGEVQPPVKVPLNDAARALQFVRTQAEEWNFDKTRIGAAGGSAGACTALWLALHDDLAEPNASDPVSRESTHFNCLGLMFPQTSLDPVQMKAWIPNSKYGAHAFGRKNFAEFLTDRDEILPWIQEYSPYGLLRSDAPPSCLFYKAPPALGEEQKDPTHSASFGVKFQERCHELGVECALVYPGADVPYATPTDYFIQTLKDNP